MDDRPHGTLVGGDASGTARGHWSSMLWTATKVAASTGLLVWLFVRFDWTKVLDVVRVIPGIFVIWGLLLVCLGQLLAARRLQILLHAQSIKVSYGLSVRLTFIGLFAGNFLPSTVGGDAAKIILLARKGYGKTVSTLSVATDRLMGLVAFAFLLPTVLATPRIVRLEDIGSSAEVVGVIASIGAAILVAEIGRHWICCRSRRRNCFDRRSNYRCGRSSPQTSPALPHASAPS